MSKRLDIINTLENALSVIKTTNGYNTNLGDMLYRFKKNIASDSMPVAVIEYDLSKGEENQIITLWSWQLIPTIKVVFDTIVTETQTDAYLTDVLNAVKNINWQGLVTDFRLNNVSVNYEQGDKWICVLNISFIINYHTEQYNI